MEAMNLSTGDTTVELPVQAGLSGFLQVELGALSHVGKVRPNNEDQYLTARLHKSMEILASSLPPEQHAPCLHREGHFFMVADGMGGHAGGERASAMVVQAAVRHIMETAKWFFQVDDPDDEVRLRLLRESLEATDRQIVEEGERNPSLAGMGTTLTAACIIGPDLFIVHVGDSRAYLLRGDHLEQLTQDHTVAQELVQRGVIGPAEAKTHRLRHVLTNVVGGRRGVEGEIVKLRLADGDRILLCTDGLTGAVPDERITGILRGHAPPQEICRALVEAALDGSGRDNITAVIAACSFPAEMG
jgi:protein phosphatase